MCCIIFSDSIGPDFFDGEKAVYFFSIEEPEGKYGFTKLEIVENGGFIQSSMGIPIDIGFEIEKGKVKYLGEIYVDYNQSFIGLNNESERDIRKLNEKFRSRQINLGSPVYSIGEILNLVMETFLKFACP